MPARPASLPIVTDPFSSPLVSTDWLAARLGDAGLVILDASWYLPAGGRSARAEYLAGHIPSAVFFDLDAASAPIDLPHTLPTAEAFAACAGGLGIASDDRVVVYDGSGANLSAGRVWWMFRAFGHRRVAVLDGGMGKWRAEGRLLQRGVVTRPPALFEAVLEAGRLSSVDDVAAALGDSGRQVVDMRSAGRFEGREPEPRPGLPSGHMPGARNLPYSDLAAPDGTLLPPEALRARLTAAGVLLDRPVIATCGSGTSACAFLLAMEALGLAPGRLYDGSWTEWAGTGRPVEQGPGRRASP